jgi:hypothetical protein
VLALATGGLVCLVSTKGARQVWSVSRGCLLLLGTWSCLCISRGSVLPYTRFCNCLLDYDFVLHIVNFAISYIFFVFLFVCLFVYSHTSNFSAIWWLSPLPVTGLQI